MTRQERLISALFLAAIMLLAPVAGVVGAAGVGTTGTQTSSTDDIVEINDGLSVWQGAVLPFRAETTAETTVTAIPGLAAESDTQGPASLNRDAISVYDTGDPVTFSYKTTDLDTSGFAGDVKILVGYLDEDDGSLSDLPITSDRLLEELSQDDLGDLNNNVTFSLEDETLDSDGELDGFEYSDVDDPGFYTFVMVEDDDDALSVSDGGVEIDSAQDSPTVIGLEQIAAHDDPSDVTVSADEPGDDVTFDIDATQLDGDVEHAVALYNADDFDDSSMTFVVDGELSTDLSVEDVTIKHSIENLNGVQTIDDDVTFFDQRSSTGITLLSDVVTILADESGFGEPETEVDGDGDTLDTSSVVTVADADTELTVETYDNWTEGDYQWIHVAMGSSSDQFQSSEGTVSIEGDDSVPSSGGSSGSSASPDDDDDDPVTDDDDPVTDDDDDPVTDDDDPVTDDDDSVADDDDPVTDDDDSVTDDDTADDAVDIAEPDDDDTADDADDDGSPGFGLTAAIVAFLSIALLAIRQQP